MSIAQAQPREPLNDSPRAGSQGSPSCISCRHSISTKLCRSLRRCTVKDKVVDLFLIQDCSDYEAR